MRLISGTLVLVICLVWCVAAPAADEPLSIDPNERVLHLIGTPFEHSYCLPRLETVLLEHFAKRGLIYRRIQADAMQQVAGNLELYCNAYRPTLVILQSSNNDLLSQYRSPTFDFTRYPQQLDDVVSRLRRQGIKVVVCSVVPVGNGSTPQVLLPPNDGLRQWVDAAQTTATRHGATFVDLFTAAVDWPMIGGSPRQKNHYLPAEHERSFKLLRWRLGLPEVSPALLESKPWLEELARGHDSVRELNAIRVYRLPAWVRSPDFAQQQQAAMAIIIEDLARHDQAVKTMLAAHHAAIPTDKRTIINSIGMKFR